MRGFKKDGGVDLRMLPDIVERPLMRHSADGLAWQQLHTGPGEQPPDRPLIEIDSRLSGRAKLETVIHEAMHLTFPWMMEYAVAKSARYIAMIVWKIGYRLEDERED